MAQSRSVSPGTELLSTKIADKVSELYPISVSSEVFEENPQFTKLVSDLCNQLKSHGVTEEVHRQIQEAEDDLKRAKHTYLQEKIIYDALHELLFEYENSNQKSSTSKLYSSIRERLTGAEVCDYLNCPESPSKQEWPLLGLSKDFVLNHLPSIDAEVLNNKIIPQVEEVVFKRCKTILHFQGQETSDKHVSTKISQLPACLEAEKRALETKEHKLEIQKRATEKMMWNYFEAMLDAIDLMKKLITEYHLKARKEYNSTTAKFLVVKCNGLLLKARVAELQLLCDTYNAETVSALKCIKVHLQEEEEKTEKEVGRVSNLLEVYQSVSSTFDELVQEYTRLQSEIDNQKWALRELKRTL